MSALELLPPEEWHAGAHKEATKWIRAHFGLKDTMAGYVRDVFPAWHEWRPSSGASHVVMNESRRMLGLTHGSIHADGYAYWNRNKGVKV